MNRTWTDKDWAKLRDQITREVDKTRRNRELGLNETCNLDLCKSKFRISPDGLFASIKVRVLSDKLDYVYTLVDIGDLKKSLIYYIFARLRNEKYRVQVTYPKSPSLARFLLDISDPEIIIGYSNGDSLDNRRSNIVIRTKGDPGNRFQIYYGPNWQSARDFAMERAGGICQRCTKVRAIHIHHRLPVRFFENPSDAHFPDNLLAVCRRCHLLEHKDIRNNLPLLSQIRFRKVNR